MKEDLGGRAMEFKGRWDFQHQFLWSLPSRLVVCSEVKPTWKEI